MHSSSDLLPLNLLAATFPNVAASAFYYLQIGLSVLPLIGKRPALSAWEIFQTRPATLTELKHWRAQGLFTTGNIGIVCGAVSQHLVVIDFDKPAAYRQFQRRFPRLTRTWTIRTGGGGWHTYYQVEHLPPSMRAHDIDLCSTGRQVVAPPSFTKQLYQIDVPLPIQPLRDLNPVIDWITNQQHHGTRPPTAPPAQPLPTRVPELTARISQILRSYQYRQKGSWLIGPCIYPERHTHADRTPSFGFNILSGYGNCFVCGSILAKDIARAINFNP